METGMEGERRARPGKVGRQYGEMHRHLIPFFLHPHDVDTFVLLLPFK